MQIPSAVEMRESSRNTAFAESIHNSVTMDRMHR